MVDGLALGVGTPLNMERLAVLVEWENSSYSSLSSIPLISESLTAFYSQPRANKDIR
jgi:hypothetical protein